MPNQRMHYRSLIEAGVHVLQLRDKRLEQITIDHTMAQKFVEGGALTAEQAEKSRWSHVLWKALGGGGEELLPDVYKGQLTTGDTLLLCSDGLTKHVSHDELLSTLLGSKNAEETCQQLVAMANSAGGTDNVTIVIAKFIADVRGDSLPSSGE
jgi:protein phosphatase